MRPLPARSVPQPINQDLKVSVVTTFRVFGLLAIFLAALVITGIAPRTAQPGTGTSSDQASSGAIDKTGTSLTEGLWITRGFEGFARGVMGNAGQNLYVSRNGILQRLHQYDWNQDGYLDLVICNSHDYWEKPDAYVYREVFGERIRQDLPSDGAVSGALHDLNGDGYDDLVLAMKQNGTRADLNAFIYFGDAEGMSERRRLLLPVPGALSVTAGDFNGDGRPDLAFARPESLRVFYQNDLTFEPKRYVERSVQAFQLTSADLDSDGFSDLFLFTGGGTRILWGGPSGISESNATEVTLPEDRGGDPTSGGTTPATESKSEFRPLPRCLVINDVPHLVVPQSSRVLFVPVSRNRVLGNPVTVDCPRVVSAAVGDINGNGVPDLVFASRSRHGEHQASWICWDLKNGFEPARRTAPGNAAGL